MPPATRRDALSLGLAGSAAIALSGKAAAAPPPSSPDAVAWARGIEGQRRADLGNGRYLNPVLAGDHPDPTILKDGEDYYMTHSSFDASPGLLLWHSRDLVNWTPIGTALAKPLGTVFAVDLIKHDGRYFIYIPFMRAPWSTGLAAFANIFVIHADDIRGPWSEPVDLGIGGLIDPGHIVGEDGHRYLFLSGINRVKLSADGLKTDGPVEKVYDGWRYPDDWVTEAYSLEGPKLVRRGGWFYIISAVGGTAGPATGHMVIVARSRSVHGPWENAPDNPIVRTWDANERWLSRGHATAVEGPGGQWHFVYHGYENGFRTLGRQTLIEPIAWTEAGWPRALGGDLAKPLPKPGNGPARAHGLARSDDFSRSSLGTRWTFYGGSPAETGRANFADGALTLRGKGSGPHDCSPLTQLVGDQAYEISVEMDLIGETQAGLLLFFNNRLFLGMGHDGKSMTSYRGGKPSYWREPAPAARTLHLRIRNERHIVTFFYSANGKDWTRHAVRSETSGYNANTIDDLASLRPALFATGSGSARFRNFQYRALQGIETGSHS